MTSHKVHGIMGLEGAEQVIKCTTKKVVEIREVRGGSKMAVCADMRSNGEKRGVPSIVIFGVFLSPRLYGFSAFVGLPILQKRV